MKEMDLYILEHALLCIQGSFFDAVTPELRAIVFDLFYEYDCDPWLFLRVYYDGNVNEETIERWCCSFTEASAGLGINYSVDQDIEQLDFPKPIPFLGPIKNGGYLAFLRWKEDKTEIDPANIFPLTASDKIRNYPESWALLVISNALLGTVSPELRAVTVEIPPGSSMLDLCFFHDGKITDEIDALWKKAGAEISLYFEEKYRCNAKIIRVDFPQKVPLGGGRLAYFRKELSLD